MGQHGARAVCPSADIAKRFTTACVVTGSPMGDARPPLAPGMMRVLLSVHNRRLLYEAIVASPGQHLRQLSRELGLAMGVVSHHARQLEKHGLVFSRSAHGRRCMYAVGQFSEADAGTLQALRDPERAGLLAALLDGGQGGVASLAARLDRPPTTVSYQLRRLRDDGLLDNIRIGRESIYTINDPQRVRRLLYLLRPDAEPGHEDTAFVGLVARAKRHGPGTRREPTSLVQHAD